MYSNPIRTRWSEGHPVINGWLSIPSAFSAEIVASQGYDCVGIDMQHGMIDFQAAVSMLQAMAVSRVPGIVRVPWLDPAPIMKALDAGAYGVICPMINTASEAERLVSYVRYPPTGGRSYGPARAIISAGPTYPERADEEILCLAMIETAEGLDNLEEIAAVEGLDGIYVGPADLTLALTGKRYRIGFDREEPEMVAAIQRVAEVCRRLSKRAGIHCGTPAYAAKAISWGYDLVTLAGDARMLAAAAAQDVSAMRGLLDRPAT